MGNSYQDLIAWQQAMDVAEHVYRISAKFPQDERFGLISQVRRAAVSVPSNIAEGQGRGSKGEFVLFLGHAKGSLHEVETQLQLAVRCGFIKKQDVAPVLQECDMVGRLITGLIQSLKRDSA
jgi:four helix bundle protein